MTFSIYNGEATLVNRVALLTNAVEAYHEIEDSFYKNIAGLYETVIEDWISSEPYVVTLITEDGYTLSKFFTDSSKTTEFESTDTDLFTQLSQDAPNKGSFVRFYVGEKDFTSAGQLIFSYQSAENEFFFVGTAAGQIEEMYSRTTYTNPNQRLINMEETSKNLSCHHDYEKL